MSTSADLIADIAVPRLLLTPTEAARALGIGRSKLYELLGAGLLESVRVGAARRVPVDALADYVQSLREESAHYRGDKP